MPKALQLIGRHRPRELGIPNAEAARAARGHVTQPRRHIHRIQPRFHRGAQTHGPGIMATGHQGRFAAQPVGGAVSLFLRWSAKGLEGDDNRRLTISIQLATVIDAINSVKRLQSRCPNHSWLLPKTNKNMANPDVICPGPDLESHRNESAALLHLLWFFTGDGFQELGQLLIRSLDAVLRNQHRILRC